MSSDSFLGVHVTLDCLDPAVMSSFWSAALDAVAGPIDQFTTLKPRSGGPDLTLQRVTDLKAGKNRMHFDLRVEDLDGEIDRLIGLGAAVVDRHEEPGWRWAVMADPEGNEFCVMRPEWYFAATRPPRDPADHERSAAHDPSPG